MNSILLGELIIISFLLKSSPQNNNVNIYKVLSMWQNIVLERVNKNSFKRRQRISSQFRTGLKDRQ